MITIGKIRPSEIRWETLRLKKAFYKLKETDFVLYKQINSALNSIEEDAFCSILLPRRLIPKRWKKYPTVWKYDLPKGWRLFYTVAPPGDAGRVVILAIILDWMDHKEYERLFNY